MNSEMLAKKLVSGSSMRVIGLMCNVVVGFFLMPFIIHSLGDRMYGFWILVGTLMGYYGVLDFGLYSAAQRFVSRAIGRKDSEEMNRFINTSLCLFSLIGCLTLIISFVITIFCPIFIDNPAEVDLFRKLIFLLGLSMSIGFPMRVFLGTLSAHIRYDLLTYIDLVKLLLRSLLIYYFLRIGYGILSLGIITSGVEISTYILTYVFTKSVFPGLKISFKYVSKSSAKPLANYGFYSFVINIGQYLRSYLDAFVISSFLGVNLVTHYSIASRLIDFFKQFIFAAVGIMTPVFSQYEGQGQMQSIKNRLIDVTKLNSVACTFIGLNLIIYGKTFIERWVGKEYLDCYPALVVLSISSTLMFIQTPSISLLYGLSKTKFLAISICFEGIVNLILSLILVKPHGIYGVGLGTFIPMTLFGLFILPVYVSRVVRMSLYDYYVSTMLVPMVKAMIVILSYYFIVKDLVQPDYVRLFMVLLMEFLVFMVVAFFLIIDSRLRALVKRGIGY